MDSDTLTGAQFPDEALDADEFAPPVDLPPHYADTLALAESEIAAAYDATVGEVAALIAQGESEVGAALTEVNVTVASVLGQMDAELRAVMTPVASAIDRTVTAALRELIHAHEELIAYGVPIPRDVSQMSALLDDPDALIATVMYDPEQGAPPALSSSAPPETVILAGDDATQSPVPSALDSPFVDALVDSAPPYVPPEPEPAAPVVAPVEPAPRADEPTPPKSECGCAPVVNVTCPGATATTGAPSSPAPKPAEPEQPVELFDVFAGLAPGAPAAGVAAVADAPRELPPVDRRVGLRWDMVTVCSDADESLRTYRRDETGRPLDPAATLDSISGIYRRVRAGFFSSLDTIGEVGTPEHDRHKEDAERAYYETTGDILGGLSAVAETLNRVDTTALPDRSTTWNLGLVLASARKAEADSQFPMSYAVQSLEYLYHYSAPQYIPAQAVLDEAYLSDLISRGRWECLTRAHGNIPAMHEWAIDAKQVRPGVTELIDLYRRGNLTRDQLHVRTRQMGAINQEYVNELLALSEWIPSAPDIMRFVKRDVFDENAVALGGLDTDFETSFYGRGGRENPSPAVKWARAHGLTDEVFKYDYRASWEFPSNTAVYEMLHRLRADRGEVKQWEARRRAADVQGVNLKEWDALNPRPPVVTEADARAVFKVNDVAPAWVERLIAISYHPMTRTDALAAYHADAMDATELIDRLRDTGLDEPTAERVVEIQRITKARRAANISGVWTIRKVAKAYKDGALLAFDADAMLQPLIPDAQQRFDLLRGVDAEIDADTRRARIKRIRREHLTGARPDAQIEAQLLGMRIPQLRIDSMMAQWQDDRTGRLKEPAAKMVVDWLKAGVVTAEVAHERLMRIGYMREDADRMVTMGLKGQELAADQRARKVQADVRRIIKDQRQAARESKEELEKAQRSAEKEAERLAKEIERIRKELMSRMP